MEFIMLLVVGILLFLFFRSRKEQLNTIESKLDNILEELEILKENKLPTKVSSISQESPLLEEKTKDDQVSFAPSTAIIEEPEEIKNPVEQTLRELLESRNTPEKIVEEIVSDSLSPEIETEKTEELTEPSTYNDSIEVEKESFIEKMITKFRDNNPDIEKFVGENLISKIGILILVLGISFFVKHAIDQEWINEIGRVALGFLSGGILIGFAYKLQREYKAFSSILVGGAIVVFYFIIAYAFQEYEIFSQEVAFVLLVLVTIFSTSISILYNRKELAIFSLIGGFTVPLMVSSNSGNYLVLFTYIFILSVGFLIISIKRNWKIILVLEFIFTHLYFLGWIISKLEVGEHLNLFLISMSYYFLFLIGSIVFLFKERKEGVDKILMSIALMNTLFFYGEGISLLTAFAPEFKGIFTLFLAIINLVFAWVLFKNKAVKKDSIYLPIGLTLTFITLVGPIQLTGNYITLFWAAESVLLIWLSQKVKNNDLKFVAWGIQILMLFRLVIDFIKTYDGIEDISIILNKGFITGIFCSISLIIAALLCKKEGKRYLIRFDFYFDSLKVYKRYIGAGLLTAYITVYLELLHQSFKYFDYYLAVFIMILYVFIPLFYALDYMLKRKDANLLEAKPIIAICFIMVNILILAILPGKAYLDYAIEGASSISFYIHILLFLITLLFLYKVHKQVTKKDAFYVKIRYVLYTLLVGLISVELLNILMPIFLGSFDNSINNFKIEVIKVGFPILWGVLAFTFLYLGIKKENKEWRLFSLVLIGITVVKLFMYDISNVSQTGKIIAFIVLGIVLLIISFMYQRIKNVLFKNEE